MLVKIWRAYIIKWCAARIFRVDRLGASLSTPAGRQWKALDPPKSKYVYQYNMSSSYRSKERMHVSSLRPKTGPFDQPFSTWRITSGHQASCTSVQKNCSAQIEVVKKTERDLLVVLLLLLLHTRSTPSTPLLMHAAPGSTFCFEQCWR
jgi:hypothetical protein